MGNKYWDQNARFRKYDHPVIRLFADQRINFLRRYISIQNINSALDVGCGNGFSSYYILKYISNLWGVDNSIQLLAENPLPNDRKICASADNLPFENSSFDLVYSWELLHHLDDPLKAVREMARVSKKYVLLFEPNRYNPGIFLLGFLEKEHRKLFKYSMSYVKGLAAEANLKIIKCAVVGAIFPNKTPLWLGRLLVKMPFEIPCFGISNVIICEKMT